ncbi:MAG: ACT domain-containing protein [Desulfobacteraceae bacterium]
MNKLIITILGKDRPGIIAAVSASLFHLECNIENVNQMILQDEFAGFFVVDPHRDLDKDGLKKQLAEALKETNLRIHVDTINKNNSTQETTDSELFLITTIGPDQKGLVAGITEVIARFNVNVINLKAMFKGGDDPNSNIMSYEVAITRENDKTNLFSALKKRARELNLDISIQHKNIFQTINKI